MENLSTIIEDLKSVEEKRQKINAEFFKSLFGYKKAHKDFEKDLEQCQYCDKVAIKKVEVPVLESPKDLPHDEPQWLCEEHLKDYEENIGVFEPDYGDY